MSAEDDDNKKFDPAKYVVVGKPVLLKVGKVEFEVATRQYDALAPRIRISRKSGDRWRPCAAFDTAEQAVAVAKALEEVARAFVAPKS